MNRETNWRPSCNAAPTPNSHIPVLPSGGPSVPPQGHHHSPYVHPHPPYPTHGYHTDVPMVQTAPNIMNSDHVGHHHHQLPQGVIGLQRSSSYDIPNMSQGAVYNSQNQTPLQHGAIIAPSPSPSPGAHYHPQPSSSREHYATTWTPPAPYQSHHQLPQASHNQHLPHQLQHHLQPSYSHQQQQSSSISNSAGVSLDLWTPHHLPPILPDVTTPSPVPFQHPLSTTASSVIQQQLHFCPVHSAIPSSSNPMSSSIHHAILERRVPTKQVAAQLTEEEKEAEHERLKEFAERFKLERNKFGYSSANVNQQLAIRYGTTFSFGKIDQFEAQHLPLPEMMAMKQILEWWLLDTARASGMSEKSVQELAKSVCPPRKEFRKRRTMLDENTRGILEDEFARNNKPNSSQLLEISTKAGIDKEVVKIWFANQRQRMKKTNERMPTEPAVNQGEAGNSLAGGSSGPEARNLVPGYNFEPDIPSMDIEAKIPLLQPEDNSQPPL